MSKFQINDVKIDDTELFNDSVSFFNELDQIVGGSNLSDFERPKVDLNKSIYDVPGLFIEPINSNKRRHWYFCPQPHSINSESGVFINDPSNLSAH